MVQAMGLGMLGDPGIRFKRKFRWTLGIEFCWDGEAYTKAVPQEFVKVAGRPNIDVEETEVNWMHGKKFLPGKAVWQPMTVTYYDVAGTPLDHSFAAEDDGQEVNLASLFSWIATVYDITNPTTLFMGGTGLDYEGVGTLKLYDGCGTALESWTLFGMWPQNVNFGELDMDSSDVCTVELTVRYQSVTYSHLCPTQTISRCACTPCS